MVVVAVIGRVLTEVPGGFHIGLLLRQEPNGSLDVRIAAPADLNMSLDQIIDLLEDELGRCREDLRVRSTIEEMEKQI